MRRLLLAMVLSAASLGLVVGTGCSNSDETTQPTPTGGGMGGAAGHAGAGGSGAAAGSGAAGASGGGAPTGAWSMGYYASWQPDDYPVSEIEWSGLTHVAMSFYEPSADGSLSLLGGDPQLAVDLVTAARSHGVSPIASIGGSDSATSFRQATAAGTIDAFVANLAALLDTPGYDGIDIDWEPMETTDEPAVIDLAGRLRTAHPGLTMTIPIGAINVNMPPDLSGYPAIAAAYDQLNVMSYGMAGAWEGWNSWHSSPLYQQDSATPTSIDSTVTAYDTAGVPLAKLGIGIGFYGLCYSPPVTGPDLPLNGATLIASDGTMSFTNIMGSYYDPDPSARQWDSFARVPYLSFASAHAPDGCSYISYDDEQSIEEKGAYLKSKGLGGVIQWEINEGYLAAAPAGQRSPLLTAIHDHVLH